MFNAHTVHNSMLWIDKCRNLIIISIQVNHKRADLSNGKWKAIIIMPCTIVSRNEHFAKIKRILLCQLWLQRCVIMNSKRTVDLRPTNGTLCDVHHHEWNMRSSLFHFRSTEFESVFSFVCIYHIVHGSVCVVSGVWYEVWNHVTDSKALKIRWNPVQTNKFAFYFSSSENFTNVTGLRCAVCIHYLLLKLQMILWMWHLILVFHCNEKRYVVAVFSL